MVTSTVTTSPVTSLPSRKIDLETSKRDENPQSNTGSSSGTTSGSSNTYARQSSFEDITLMM